MFHCTEKNSLRIMKCSSLQIHSTFLWARPFHCTEKNIIFIMKWCSLHIQSRFFQLDHFFLLRKNSTRIMKWSSLRIKLIFLWAKPFHCNKKMSYIYMYIYIYVYIYICSDQMKDNSSFEPKLHQITCPSLSVDGD